MNPYAPPQHRPRPQFHLRALFWFTTGMCVLFAILGAIGVSPLETLIGFAFVSGVVLAQAALLELFAQR